jgi:hypothetical protein
MFVLYDHLLDLANHVWFRGIATTELPKNRKCTLLTRTTVVIVCDFLHCYDIRTVKLFSNLK